MTDERAPTEIPQGDAAELLRAYANASRIMADAAARGRLYSPDVLRAQSDLYDRFRVSARKHHAALAEADDPVLDALLVHRWVHALLAGEFSPSGHTIAWHTHWRRYAQPTFILTESLLANLILTDPQRVSFDDVSWPFPAFRIVLPDPGAEVLTRGGDGRPSRVRGIHVAQWNFPRPLATSGYLTLDRAVDDAELRELAASARIPLLVVSVRDSRSNGTTFIANTEDVGSVGAWIDGTDERGVDDEAVTADEVRAMKVAKRLAVNLALYLASDNPETEQPTWTPADKVVGKGKTWIVGREVRISKEVREAAVDVARGRHANAPTVRHVVRGHFRNQACGKGHQDHKRIYIKPFWRGPGEDPGKPRTYKVT